MIKLKVEDFIENANLQELVGKLTNLNKKIAQLDKGKNPQLLMAIHRTLLSLNRLNDFYMKQDFKDVTYQEKQETLKKLIMSHQSLLKVQSKVMQSNSEHDKKLQNILLDVLTELSAIYPLFLVSEIILADITFD